MAKLQCTWLLVTVSYCFLSSVYSVGDPASLLSNAANAGNNVDKAAGAAKLAGLAKGLGGGDSNCNPPSDSSCDAMPSADMIKQIGGGDLAEGAGKGIFGLGGGRRRRAAGQLAAALAAGGGDPSSAITQFAGGSFLTDPDMLGLITRKMKQCDENKQDYDEMKPGLDKLTSGNFQGIQADMQSKVSNVGNTCKKAMNTEKDKCELLKRQCCAILKGKISSPCMLKSAGTDVLKTAGKIQAKDTSCDTAEQLIKNPNNAGKVLEGGGQGLVKAGALNAAGGMVG